MSVLKIKSFVQLHEMAHQDLKATIFLISDEVLRLVYEHSSIPFRNNGKGLLFVRLLRLKFPGGRTNERILYCKLLLLILLKVFIEFFVSGNLWNS